MASPETKHYRKTTGFATTKGQMFEVKISALLFVRGLNIGHDFQLAANVDGAGAFDDVVFRLKSPSAESWTTFLVQLKHNSSWLTLRMLTDSKGKFSLPAYCKSYVDLKRCWKAADTHVLFNGEIGDCLFVIFTNAKPNPDLGEGHQGSEQFSEVLGSNSGRIFRFNPDGQTNAERTVWESLKDFADERKDFLRHLRVFSGQPCETELDVLIKDELRKLQFNSQICDVDVDRLNQCFIENIRVWWQDQNYVLHGRSDILLRACHKVVVETLLPVELKANRLGLVFEEDALSCMNDVLRSNSSVVYIESSESSSRLTCTKLLQALKCASCLFLGIECLLANQTAVLSEWGSGQWHTLIVSLNSVDPLPDKFYFVCLKEFCKTALYPEKRLVILTEKNHLLLSVLEEVAGTIFINDRFDFLSLTSSSRKNFLSKNMTVQGCRVPLDSYFGGTCNDITASLIVQILELGEKLSLGPAVADHAKFYIPRTLRQRNVLKGCLFQVRYLPSTVSISQSTTADIQSFVLQADTSLGRQTVEQTLSKFSELPLLPHGNNHAVFVGDTFALGMFGCRFVGAAPKKATGLLICPYSLFNCKSGWFLFVFRGAGDRDAAELDGFFQSRHFLKMTNGELVWIKSLDLDCKIILNHIDETKVTFIKTDNVTDIEGRLVVVCGEPGMGKSTLVSRHALMTKKVKPHFWVISTKLNEHADLFADGLHHDALGFLLAVSKKTSPLEQALLKFALEKTGNVAVLLDGFDEIAPTYVPQCCQLISILLDTNAKHVWVTTRNSALSPLKDYFSVSPTGICKFTAEEQRCFFKLYWTSLQSSAFPAGVPAITDLAIDDLITRLLEMTSRSIGDWEKDFVGIPLQAEIVAEVYIGYAGGASHLSTLPDTLEVLPLLDRFVETKLGVCVRDKLGIKSTDTNYQTHLSLHRTAFVTRHMEAALVLLLFDDHVKDLRSRGLLTETEPFFRDIENGTEKTGLVSGAANGRPQFVHRVLAEYFAAEWFAANPPEYAGLLVREAYHAFRGGFATMRRLCDLSLARGCPLHAAVLDGDVAVVRTLLADGVDVAAADAAGRTPLHLAAAAGHMEDTEENHVEIMRLLVAKTTDLDAEDGLLGGTPLRYADLSEYWLMMDVLLARGADSRQLTAEGKCLSVVNFKDYILTNDLDSLLAFSLDKAPLSVNEQPTDILTVIESGLLAEACTHGSFCCASLLVKRGHGVNGTGLSVPTRDKRLSPLHCASKTGHLQIVQLLVDANDSSTADFINAIASDGSTPLVQAFWNGHAETAAFLIGRGGDVTISDERGFTCLNIAVRCKREDLAILALDAVGEADRPAFVNAANSVWSTPLHWAATHGMLGVARLLVQAGARMQSDRYRLTPLMLAARSGHLDVVEYLATEFVGKTDWINARDEEGWTAIDAAASLGYGSVVTFLRSRGAETSDELSTKRPKERACYFSLFT